jgi:ATP-dependent DNA helicase RecG
MALLLEAEAGKAELAKKLGHQSVSGGLKKQITHLLSLTFIQMTRPGVSNSRLQKYRLTGLGREQFKQP